MNKQEAIKQLKWKALCSTDFYRMTEVVELEKAKEIISKIDEPAKPVVPQVAVDYYNQYKKYPCSLSCWLSDLECKDLKEQFPKIDELIDWLYGHTYEEDRKRELAFATLITYGVDAVDVEKEKRYTVEIPDPNCEDSVIYLCKDDGKVVIGVDVLFNEEPNDKWKQQEDAQLTESEIKQDFEWLWNVKGAVEEVDG